MTEFLMSGRAIQLNARFALERRRQWRLWKQKGYRVLDPDGVTVWHEKEAIRHFVLDAFAKCDADVFLFGSRASGEAREGSDYDVGYWADYPPSATRLALLRETLEELPIPSHVDLVDFRNVADEFMQIALENNEVEIWKRRSKNSIFT